MKRLLLFFIFLIPFFVFGQVLRMNAWYMPDTSTNFPQTMPTYSLIFVGDNDTLYSVTSSYASSDNMHDVITDGNYIAYPQGSAGDTALWYTDGDSLKNKTAGGANLLYFDSDVFTDRFNFSTSNTIFGFNACGTGNLTGLSNTAIGANALRDITGGQFNVAVGASAGLNLENGSNNFAMGYQALQASVSGGNNVALGYRSLLSSTGSNNVAVGRETIKASLSNNTAIGYEAGENNVGTGSVFIGYQSGQNETGGGLLYIDNSNTTTPLIWGDFSSNYVNINGWLGIGTETPSGEINIVEESSDLQINADVFSNTAGHISGLYLRKGRGTVASKLALQDNDNIAQIRMMGQTGAATTSNVFEISVDATENYNVSKTGSGVYFKHIENGTNAQDDRMVFDSLGNIALDPVDSLDIEGRFSADYTTGEAAYFLVTDGDGYNVKKMDTASWSGAGDTSFFDLSAAGGELSTKTGIDTLTIDDSYIADNDKLHIQTAGVSYEIDNVYGLKSSGQAKVTGSSVRIQTSSTHLATFTTTGLGVNQTTPDSTLHVTGGATVLTDILVGGGWAAWVPTLAWTGGTPGAPTIVARYEVTNNRVNFSFDIQGTNDSGSTITGVTLTPPVTIADVNMLPAFSAAENNGGTTTPTRLVIGIVDQESASNRKLGVTSLSINNTNDYRITGQGFYEITGK